MSGAGAGAGGGFQHKVFSLDSSRRQIMLWGLGYPRSGLVGEDSKNNRIVERPFWDGLVFRWVD